jgi:NADH-quinone oxidoreductase subunit E
MQSIATKVESLLKKHNYERKALISILQEIQGEYNYLPREALISVSKALNIPLIDIIGVATFYKAFCLKPRGKHIITVCMGTACHVRGAPRILEELERKLNIKEGETSNDKLFTLETVNCLGACALGPIVVTDGNYYGQMTVRKTDKLIERLKKEEGVKDEKK